MASWFKGIILGLGVLLGVASERESPAMEARPHRDADSIYVSVELFELPGKELEELVRSAYTVRLTLSARAGQLSASAWREISFDGLRYSVSVSETGGRHETGSMDAAWAIVSRFARLRLGPIASLEFPFDLKCKAVLSLPDDDESDPMLFWAYKPSAAVATVDALGSIPYY